MSRAFFDEAADALAGFLPRALRTFGSRTGAHNLKVWFGEESHEHYEIQRVSKAALTAGGIRARGPALEIGFHSEHPSETRNEEVLTRLGESEATWRPALGREAVAGRFVGRQTGWRRLSEVWVDGDLHAEGAAVEAANRLAAYIRALEPLRAPRSSGR